MALESASQPTLVAIQNGPAGQSLLTLMKHHTAESSDEQRVLDQIKGLLKVA